MRHRFSGRVEHQTRYTRPDYPDLVRFPPVFSPRSNLLLLGDDAEISLKRRSESRSESAWSGEYLSEVHAIQEGLWIPPEVIMGHEDRKRKKTGVNVLEVSGSHNEHPRTAMKEASGTRE